MLDSYGKLGLLAEVSADGADDAVGQARAVVIGTDGQDRVVDAEDRHEHKALELKIDNFHDKIIDAAMMFKKGIRVYLSEGRSEEFKKINRQIKQIEHDADGLRRDIEN